MRDPFQQSKQNKWRNRQRQESLSWNKESRVMTQCLTCNNKGEGEVQKDGYWSTQCRDYEKAARIGFCKNHRTEEEIKFLGKSW